MPFVKFILKLITCSINKFYFMIFFLTHRWHQIHNQIPHINSTYMNINTHGKNKKNINGNNIILIMSKRHEYWHSFHDKNAYITKSRPGTLRSILDESFEAYKIVMI